MSIRRLRAHFVRDDSGLGMVEIIVALMIFAIVTVGMSYSMISMTRLTGDAAARETAANLAAAEIDRVQGITDAFTVHDALVPTQVVVDGITYNVETNTSWVGANGSTGDCGIGGGQLQYKRVRVTVTWDGMYLKNPVRADSALAPGTRINDPSTGTILVRVQNEGGDGQSGVSVGSTGPALPDAIDATDVDGCSYVLKAPPGTYTMTFNKAGYIDSSQMVFPVSRSVVVAAGSAATVAIDAAVAHTFTVKFAANSTRTVKLPTNLDITYFGKNTAGPLNEAALGTRKVFPTIDGYQGIAGNPSTCLAVDPEKWIASSTRYAGVRPVKATSTAGGSGTLPVVMGVADVVIPGAASSNFFLTATATSVTTGGNPGCGAAVTTIYKFASFAGGSTQTIALPYGVWKLTTGASAGSTTTNITSGVTIRDAAVSLSGTGVPLTGVASTTSTFASNLLTFDPRMPKP